MPLPNPSPYCIKTTDLVLGDTIGTTLSGSSGAANKTSKEIQANVDYLHNLINAIVVNVKDFGAIGDGVADDTAAIQSAIDSMTSGGTLFFPLGTYKITGTLYLISSNHYCTYRVLGSGKGTILKPTGFTSGYVFKLNENSVGTKVISWPRHSRAIFENFWVHGSDSTSVSFLWYNQASFQIKDLTMDYLLYGAYGTEYTDLIKLENITWANQRTNGWLYRQGGKGDGFEGKRLISSGTDIANNMVWLYRGFGGTLIDCIGGYYKFEESQVTVQDGHFEESSTVGNETNHIFQIINSNVNIRNCNLRVDISTYDSIYVNDNVSVKQNTNLVLSNNIFTRNLNNGTSPLGQREVYINSLKTNSKIILENNKTLTFNADSSDYPSTFDWYPIGIKIRSNISALDTELQAMVGLLSNYIIIESIHSSWKIHPIGSFDIPLYDLSAPLISSIALSSKPASNLANATYYYRAENIDINYRYSSASSEVSIAQTGTSSITLSVSGCEPNTCVRLMRGTTPDTYDKYVDIPVIGNETIFIDCGSRINQYVWNDSVYTHKTTSITYAGTHNILTGKKILYGTAAPGAGTWLVSDTMYNIAPTAGDYLGWICTTGGTPGTWKTFGAITA